MQCSLAAANEISDYLQIVQTFNSPLIGVGRHFRGVSYAYGCYYYLVTSTFVTCYFILLQFQLELQPSIVFTLAF